MVLVLEFILAMLEAVELPSKAMERVKVSFRGLRYLMQLQLLFLKAPGSTTAGFLTRESIENGDIHPKMDGRVVFKNAVTRMLEVASTVLQRNGVHPSEIDLVVPHQANLRINEAVREKLGINEDRVFNNIQKYGNTTAATIPICMSEAVEQGKLKEGQLVLTLAFGAGFTWGCNLIRW